MATRWAMRRVSTRVLPEPAGASTTSGIAVEVTAARWASSSPSRSASGSIDGDPTLSPVVEVPLERFEELVADALDEIPDDLWRLVDNVAVVVREGSEGSSLLGLYDGVPLTRRDAGYGGSMVMPDRISIFRRPILAMCRDGGGGGAAGAHHA